MTFSPANDGKTKDQLIADILSYLTLREICDIPWFWWWFELSWNVMYLALCPQWTYLSVLIGYIADGSGNEYLIWKQHVTRFITNL